jgi:D-arabinose 1-dehydrogenase-like Zn-dependent alcohol dehydrogenase
MFCRHRQALGRTRHGADAELLLVPARNCLPLPEAFTYEEGALLACNVGTAYAAMKKAAASGRGAVAVFGLGPVGQYCVQAGRAMGADVIGVDPVASRRDAAQRLGTLAVVDPSSPDAIDAISRVTGS